MTHMPSTSVKTKESITELNACTVEDLEQLLAGLLMHAGTQVLNDTEVQEFWHVYQQIQRLREAAA